MEAQHNTGRPQQTFLLKAVLTVGIIAALTFLIVNLLRSVIAAVETKHEIVVNVDTTLKSLLNDEDTDGDKKITIDDLRITGSERGNKHFWLVSSAGRRFEISGTYYLSNLLQDLKRAQETGKDAISINTEHLFEPPADRISRMVREFYWNGLTRRIDEHGIVTALSDQKIVSSDGINYLYFPSSDSTARQYYFSIALKNPDLRIQITPLDSEMIFRNLQGHHGLLTLKVQKDENGRTQAEPFVVPGGRFNEMYGWDSYFITLGLLEDGKIDLARSMVDNFVYEIRHYGKILNANRTYFLTRSQPPFLSSMVRAVYAKLPNNKETKKWLKEALVAVIHEYRSVWMNSDHITNTGLSRYFDTGRGPAPEVEKGHYEAVFTQYASRAGVNRAIFEERYKSGQIYSPGLDSYFVHDRAMRESGHDTSYRLEGRCADLATVDLNSLLYKIEKDVAELIEREFGGSLAMANGTTEAASMWSGLAKHRQELLNRFLWDPQKGMYFDDDFVHGSPVYYVSATTFYPLWAGAASREQAELVVRNALPLLEVPGGIVSSTEESRGPITPVHPQRQWDYPYGWAPHQIMVWQAMLKYGYESITQRLVYRWLYTIASNAADYNGTIAEKYDVVKRSHEVFAEYGNVGTKFSYITREGFGWTNASCQVGLRILKPELHDQLNRLIPPEWIFLK